MGANNVLSHDEKLGTKFFTGTEPGDRYKFTCQRIFRSREIVKKP
jgi:hypothetical protein